MVSITVTVDGDERKLEAGTTGADVFADHRDVVVMRVAGELRDLAQKLASGDAVESVTSGSPDGLTVLRHSCAHVLAQAVQQVNPDAKLGIGPPIENGFFYDFDVAEPFTPESLKGLEKVMQRIVNETQTFRRRVVTDAEAIAELADEPYKVELVGLKSMDVILQTTAGDELKLRVVSDPEPSLKILLDRLRLNVPKRLCLPPNVVEKTIYPSHKNQPLSPPLTP